jgi:phosphatidylinositol glycan class B
VPSSLWLKRGFFLCVATAIHLVCALQSGGWYALDEHFQTLEFAGLKLGINSPADLSWEFHQRIRPALQPAVAYAVTRSCQALGHPDPFLPALLLRMLSGLLGVASLYLLYLALEKRLESTASRAWFAAISCLLWFLPYVHVRFSSEAWSGSLFWAGAAMVMLLRKEGRKTPAPGGWWWVAGLLLGFAFVARMQSGLLVLPVLIWIGLRRPYAFKALGFALAGVATAVCLGFWLDHWLYGEWTVSAWNYFRVNLLEGVATHFGREPWWFYMARVAERATYPIGLVMLFLGGVFVATRPRDLVTWIVVPFLLVHTLVSHKEMRFLFPLVSIVPFLLVAGAEGMESWRRRPGLARFGKVLLALLVSWNVLLLVIACLKPAEPVYNLYRFIYRHYGDRQVILFYDAENPYERARFTPALYPSPSPVAVQTPSGGKDVVLEARFFKPAGLVVETWDPAKSAVGGTCLYVTRRNNGLPPSGFRLVYRYLPDWLLKFNVTGWADRTENWSLYETTPVSPP